MSKSYRSVGVLAFIAMFAAFGIFPARASDETEAQAVVTEWVAEFNRGDVTAFAARCARRAAVIDGFPPFAWTSCADWMSSYASNSKANKLTDGKLSIGWAVSAFTEGNRSYVVYPATFSDKEDGKVVVYNGTWTITLLKVNGRWAITGSGSNWGGTYTVRSEP